jgi:hypothetical protein
LEDLSHTMLEANHARTLALKRDSIGQRGEKELSKLTVWVLVQFEFNAKGVG